MPVEEKTVLRISCDNTACPGNNLDPKVREGWLFANIEIYGQPTGQHVFCGVECLSVAAGDPDQEPTNAPPTEPLPVPAISTPSAARSR